MKILIVVGLSLVLFVSAVSAEMYQWVDKDGVITFKDTPPPPSKKQKQRKVKVYSDGDFDPAPPPAAAATRSAAKPAKTAAQPQQAQPRPFNGTVEMYVTDWCGYCKQAISYASSRNIPYVAYNIDKDPAAKERHAALGGRGVPLIIIGSNKMNGWSAENFEHYLNGGR